MRTNKQNHSENGLASIVIVTVIIVLLSLITIGFAKIMDKEYRQSTDRQLASEANYAAESGMNDARAYLVNNIKNGVDPLLLDTNGKCLDLSTNPPAPFAKGGSVSQYYTNPNAATVSDNTIKYTCVILNTKPQELGKSPLKKNQSIVWKIIPSSALKNLYISWQNYDGSTNPMPNPHKLPKETTASDPANNYTGMVKATLYPAFNGDCASAHNSNCQNAAAAGAARTYFLYPNNGGAPNSVPGTDYTTQNGNFVNGDCNSGNVNNPPTELRYRQATGRFCNSKITALGTGSGASTPATATHVSINARIEGINGRATVTVSAKQGSNIVPIKSMSYVTPFNTPEPSSSCLGDGPRLYTDISADFSNLDLTATGFTNPDILINLDDSGSAGPPLTFGHVIINSVTFSDAGDAHTWLLNGVSYVDSGGNPTGQPPDKMCQQGTTDWQGTAPLVFQAYTPVAQFYYLKLTALYQDLNVGVQGTDAGNNPVQLLGAQASIDVTGEGNDTLKRLHGVVALAPEQELPGYTIQSMDTLCKRLRLPKTNNSPPTYDSAVRDDASGNPDNACLP